MFFALECRKDLLKMFLAPATSFSVPPNYTFFIYKQPVYKQLGLALQKVKQLFDMELPLKHVTRSNFANKIFTYENIATTLHNHISVNYYIPLADVILFSDFIRIPHISVPR